MIRKWAHDSQKLSERSSRDFLRVVLGREALRAEVEELDLLVAILSIGMLVLRAAAASVGK